MQRGGAIIHKKEKKIDSSNEPYEEKLSSLTQPKRLSQNITDLLNKIHEVHEFTREGRSTDRVQLLYVKHILNTHR